MLCLECGKKEAKFDGLCEDCFLKKTKFTELPQHIDLVICPHCHAVKFGGHWEHMPLNDAIYTLVDKQLKFLHEYESYELEVEHGEIEGEFPGLATVTVKFKDISAHEVHEILFDLKYESCPRCNRFFGNYFEAILQLRGLREYEAPEIISFLKERVAHYASKNENLFITKEVEKREGWDFYISDKREARKLAREISRRYGAEIKESPHIVGRKDGRDVYRVTYSVRLPEYREGDVVEVEGTYYVVERVDQTYIRGVDITTGKHKMIDSRKHRITMQKEKKEVESMMVVYQESDTVQLLTPRDEVVETRVSRTLENGKYVRVVRIDGVLYVLP